MHRVSVSRAEGVPPREEMPEPGAAQVAEEDVVFPLQRMPVLELPGAIEVKAAEEEENKFPEGGIDPLFNENFLIERRKDFARLCAAAGENKQHVESVFQSILDYMYDLQIDRHQKISGKINQHRSLDGLFFLIREQTEKWKTQFNLLLSEKVFSDGVSCLDSWIKKSVALIKSTQEVYVTQRNNKIARAKRDIAAAEKEKRKNNFLSCLCCCMNLVICPVTLLHCFGFGNPREWKHRNLCDDWPNECGELSILNGQKRWTLFAPWASMVSLSRDSDHQDELIEEAGPEAQRMELK